jgi:hypothetical protein
MNGLAFTPLRAPRPPERKAEPEPVTGTQVLQKSAQNLLAHIPGEASGLYLMGVGAMDQPKIGTMAIVSILALVLLVLVRWAGKASRGVMVTSILAFVIWMLVLDNGVLHVLWPHLLPNPLGLIVAVFYSAVVTILANAGKLT